MMNHIECTTLVVKLHLNFDVKVKLCDYSDAYIHVKETISIERVLAPAETEDVDKEERFKKCAQFTDRNE